VSYFILRNGEQYGPYSPADIERYLTVGGIVVTDLARTDEMNQWLPLSQIIRNTPPPPTAVEKLASGRVSGGSDPRSASADPASGEGSLKVQPMPPPDHAPYPSPDESEAQGFSNRLRHLLNQLGLNRSHRPHQ
jgi:hypothetical protein